MGWANGVNWPFEVIIRSNSDEHESENNPYYAGDTGGLASSDNEYQCEYD